MNGAHVETLILGYPSNPSNLIDIPEEKTEIKSCQEFHQALHSRYPGKRRAGQFKINFEQHKYLLEIEGYYLLVVQDQYLGEIKFRYKVKASSIEERFKFMERALTKHHYFSMNWKKAFKVE